MHFPSRRKPPVNEYEARRESSRRQARRRRWSDRLVNLGAGLILASGVLGLILALALLGALGIYLGWNLGVYGLAHAVHTPVGRIDFWTAFGASFAISVVRRLLSGDGLKLTLTPRS